MLLLLGCIPIPYALPPSDFSVQIDPRPAIHQVGGSDVPDGPQAIDLRAGIVPLSMTENFANRSFDPSVGFVASFRHPDADSAVDLGGYGRLAYRAWTDDLGNVGFVAVEPRATIDVWALDVDRHRNAIGYGLTLGAAFRLGGRCDPRPDGLCFSGGWNSFGVAWGEWGFALSVDGGVQQRDTGMEGRILLGLELRAPAGVGIVLVPIY